MIRSFLVDLDRAASGRALLSPLDKVVQVCAVNQESFSKPDEGNLFLPEENTHRPNGTGQICSGSRHGQEPRF